MKRKAWSIENDAISLTDKIRKFCRSQKKLWKQIPGLALNADGRTGWSDDLSLAYNSRLWRIRQVTDYTALVISLDTGELCLSGYISRSATDEEILPLALVTREIDASKIIADLKRQASSQKSDHSVIVNKIDPNWRKDLAKELGLSI